MALIVAIIVAIKTANCLKTDSSLLPMTSKNLPENDIIALENDRKMNIDIYKKTGTNVVNKIGSKCRSFKSDMSIVELTFVM